MAANINPIFSVAGDIQWGSTAITTANTAKDGTGTVLLVFTADANNGGFLQRIRFRSAGSNITTVARIFINNGLTNATASNNILFDEITLSTTTLSETNSLLTYEVPMNLVLPAGYKIYITIGTTIAAGYYVSAIGGKY
jgi:hypothetical protein